MPFTAKNLEEYSFIKLEKKSTDNPYILLVNMAGDKSKNNVMEFVKTRVNKYVVKSKTISSESHIELSIEVRLKNMSTDFVNGLSRIVGEFNHDNSPRPRTMTQIDPRIKFQEKKMFNIKILYENKTFPAETWKKQKK